MSIGEIVGLIMAFGAVQAGATRWAMNGMRDTVKRIEHVQSDQGKDINGIKVRQARMAARFGIDDDSE